MEIVMPKKPIDFKLLNAIDEISMPYTRQSSLTPEIACQRFGTPTSEIDATEAANFYQDKVYLIKALNALVDAGYLVKYSHPGQEAKWMPVKS